MVFSVDPLYNSCFTLVASAWIFFFICGPIWYSKFLICLILCSPSPIQSTIRNVCPLLYLSIGLSVLISTYLAHCAWSVCKLQYPSVVCMSLFLCHRRKPISQWTQDIWLNNVLLILAYLQTIKKINF